MAGKSGRTLAAVPERSLKKMLVSWEGMLFLLFIAVNIFCKCISPVYTFTNVLREMPKYLTEIFLLFPMAYILLMGEIDISVGSIVCLSATMSCIVSNAGMPFPIVLINFVGFRKIAGKIGPFPYLFFLVILCAVIFTVIADKKVFGRRLYAIGSNERTAFYSGIKVNRMLFTSYTVLGLLAGLSAIFLTSATYGANTTTGKGFEMDAIAMAVFGGISTAGGKGKLLGGVISAFVIICLRVGLGQINMNPQVILIILGALLILAVLLPNITQHINQKRKKASKA